MASVAPWKDSAQRLDDRGDVDEAVEIDALAAAQSAGAWTDLVREAITPDVPLYSWWSYRARDWAQSNRGRRLDHVWGQGAAADRFRTATVLKEARGWTKPSDHAPVMADFSD